MSQEEEFLKKVKLLTLVGAVVVVLGFIGVFEWEFPTPDQPIAFPHSVHAGDRQIACVFCHTGAKKWDMAGVPSVQDCYQCHQVVKTESPEIQKIKAAFDNKQPIIWHKVYNMPRHVHFSHRQHTSVAKIECYTCHGDVAEMKTAQFYNDMHMGFCINCHRQHTAENKSLMDCTTCHY